MADESSTLSAQAGQPAVTVTELEPGEPLEFLSFATVRDPSVAAGAAPEAALRRGGDSVAVLPYFQNTKTVMVLRRFRAGLAARDGADLSAIEPFLMVETLAMALDAKKDATASACARRCMRERAGLEVTDDMMRHVSTFYASPGGSSERIYFYMIVAASEPDRAPTGVETLSASAFLESVERDRRALAPLDLKILVGAEELRRWLSYAEPTALPAILSQEAAR